MELNGFSNESGARDMIVDALRYLETTDAVILDLRRNRGGDGSLVNFLISHFTGADTLASLTVRTRTDPRGSTRYTLAKVPGPRRPNIPLFVLTSRNTASAGEDCAFVLKNLQRATLVGGRTAGAGHNVTFVQSGHGFRTGISFSRVSDPRTGKEWEQVGVQPDVSVEPIAALDSAHVLVLSSLAAKSDGEQRRQLEMQRELVQSRAHARPVPVSVLAGYAGKYEGNRRVTLAGERLMYETIAGGMPEPLLALSDTEFMLSNQVRVIFERDPKGGTKIRAIMPDGATLTFARVGPASAP
jgi:hypothetical protein